ncbi:hypothetical protein [Maribacter sp. 2-571]|uniref:hypothetical protein n=1 Tax=Maribacter sp. 2-571 TaxID=3417569 RepID=UPI003D358D24
MGQEVYILYGSHNAIKSFEVSASRLLKMCSPMEYIVVYHNFSERFDWKNLLDNSMAYQAYRVIQRKEYRLIHQFLCEKARESTRKLKDHY